MRGWGRWGDGFHSSGEEAVSKSIYVEFDAPIPFSSRKRHKHYVSRVGGIYECGESSPLYSFHHMGQVLHLPDHAAALRQRMLSIVAM